MRRAERRGNSSSSFVGVSLELQPRIQVVLEYCMCCRGRKVQARDDFVPVASSTECIGSRQKMVSALNNLYKRRLIKSVDS